MNFAILIFWRVAIIIIYFYYSLNIYSLASLILCFISIFIFKPSRKSVEVKSKIVDLAKINFNKIFSKSAAEFKNELNIKYINNLEKLTIYDAEKTECLDRFRTIQINSNCLFAKKAKLWGSCSYKVKLSLEENICLWLPTFCKFCYEKKVDGFVFELPASLYSHSLIQLADAVNRTLKFLTAINKQNINTKILDKLPCDIIDETPSLETWSEDVKKKRWVFSFCQQTFFISAFSPIYPRCHPRYTYGCKNVFIFFQPELSFALHNLSLEQHRNHTSLQNIEVSKDILRNQQNDSDTLLEKQQINLSLDQQSIQFSTGLSSNLHFNKTLEDKTHEPLKRIHMPLDDQNNSINSMKEDTDAVIRNSYISSVNVDEFSSQNIRFKIREKFKSDEQDYIVYDRMAYSPVLPLDPIQDPPIDFSSYAL